MKLPKPYIIAGILYVIVMSMLWPTADSQYRLHNSIKDFGAQAINEPYAANGETYDYINDIFSAKSSEFSTQDYFSQTYESSLQATYFALYTLDALDRLDTINQTAVFNYIMGLYNPSSGQFKDSYAERYLNTNYSSDNMDYLEYYQLPSFLEVNCFAILSLKILGNLTEIDSQKAIDFIWSCYNQFTDGGFIGQPYSAELPSYFKLSTADDTYFAILALEALGDFLGSHQTYWQNTEQFIRDLQDTNQTCILYGGFLNDEVNYGTTGCPFHNDDIFFNSLDKLDVTLLTSYYCLASLEKLQAFMTYDAFHQFLASHYDSNVPFFKMSTLMSLINGSNVASTAIGLQLSDLSSWSTLDRNAVINFVLSYRNSWGMWETSSTYSYSELIDTFQVIRALKETGELTHLSYNEKTQIASSLKKYYQQYDDGFSLLPKDYTSLRLIHTMIKSALGTYYRIAQFDANFRQEIYNALISNYLYSNGDHLFGGALGIFQHSLYSAYTSTNFRSNPIEFYSELYDNQYNQIGLSNSHQTAFYALETFLYLGALSTFEGVCNLNDLAANIIESQFVTPGYSNYGGFLPSAWLNDLMDNEQRNDYVYLEYTYYAFRCLEIIVEQLEKTLADTALDEEALENFVDNTAGSSAVYYDTWYSNDVSTIMRNTYYMVYILNATAPQRLDLDKIRNFVVQNLNYSDIKNIYYAYKLSQYFSQPVDFDYKLTNQLIQDIYDGQQKSFYLTTNREILSDEVFLWICEMAKDTGNLDITALYPTSVELGSSFNLIVYLKNMVLDYFGPALTVKIKSDFYNDELDLQPDKGYEKEVYIPQNAAWYPVAKANITAYGGEYIESTLILPITILTTSSIFGNEGNSQSESISEERSEQGNIMEPSVQSALPVMITLIALPSLVIIMSIKAKKKSNGFVVDK